MRTRRPFALAVACAAFLAVAALPGAAKAAVWYVNDTSTVGDSFTTQIGADSATGANTSPFRRIQMAIDSAVVGDTIYVDAGFYYETVAITKDSVAIVGKDSGATVIEPPAGGSVLYADTQVGLLVRDLRVRGTGGPSDGIEWFNVDRSRIENVTAAFNGNNGFDLVLSDSNAIVGNRADSNVGAGFYWERSTGNFVAENVSESNALDGFMFAPSSGFFISRNTARNNSRYGLFIGDSAGVPATNNIFAQNSSQSNDSWAFYLGHQGTPSSGNLFEKNIITTGAAPIAGVFSDVPSSSFSFVRVWWNATDSTTIKAMISGPGGDSIAHIPFRLGIVDTAPNADTVAPKAPDTVAAQPLGDTVRVSWSPVTVNEEPSPFSVGLAGYTIWVSDVPNSSVWEFRGEVGPGALTFDDTDVAAGETVYYRVTAFDSWMPFRNESFYSDSQVGLSLPPTVDFMDSMFFGSPANYLTNDTAYLEVEDAAANLLPGAADTLLVTVTKVAVGNDTETVTLTEIGADSDVFRAALPLSSNPADSAAQNGKIYAVAGETLRIEYGTEFDTVLIVPPAGTVDAFAETGGPPTVPPGETDVLLLAFRVVNQNPTPDTVTQVTVRYAGTASGDVPNVSLWADSNGNAVFETGVDVRMDSGTFAGNTITLNVTAPFQDLAPSGGLRRYFVSANVAVAAPAGDTLDAFLAAGDVAHAGPDTVPSAVQNSPGFTTIVVDTAPPSAFLLIAPVEGAETNATTLLFWWTASTDSSPPVTYVIRRSTSAAFTTFADSAVGTTSAIVSGLAANETTYWRVIASDAVGNTTVAGDSSLYVDLAPPGAFPLIDPPDGLDTNQATPIVFSWGAATETGSGLFEYRVHLATNPAFAPLYQNASAGTATTLSLSPLINDTTYWRVVAIDDVGNQRLSNETFLVRVDTQPPAPFTLASPANGANTTVNALWVTWNPSGDSLSGLQQYRVQTSTNAAFAGLDQDQQVAPNTTTAFITLSNDTTWWRVVALDTAGNQTISTDSRTIFVDAVAPAPFDLSSPADLLETSATAIAFAWTASSDSSGLNRYQFQVSTSNAFSTFVLDASNGLSTNTTVTVPVNDTYFWRVIAYDDPGNSTVSTTPFRQFLVDVAPPTAAGLVGPIAGNTVVSPVLLDWNASADALSGLAGYVLQVDTAGTFVGPFVANGFQAAPDSTLALAPDTYFWRVIAQDQVGNTAASATESFVVFLPAETVPPTPGALSAPATGLETSTPTISFAWTASTDSSLPITYTLRTSTSAAFATFTDSAVGTPTSASATLAGEATWYWTVIAQDASGNTVEYASSSFIVDLSAPSVPTLVDPTAGETKTQNVLLDWNASADALSGVNRYRVQVDNDSAFGSPAVDGYQATSDTTCTLAADTYYWRVQAIDDVGNVGGFSGTESFIVVPPADTIPPDPVQNLAAAAGTDGTITLTWDGSPSSDMTGGRYVVYWDSGSGNPTLVLTSILHGGASYSYTTVVLQSGTTYSFVVRAEDASGNQNSDSTKVLATAQIVGATPVQAVILSPSAGMSILKTGAEVFLYAEITPAAQASSVSSVRFDYRADTTNPSAPWSAVQATDSVTYPNPADASMGRAFTYWNVGPIATGVYQIRAVASVGGVDDTAPPVITITLTADTNAADRVDTVVAPGEVVVLDDGRTLTATDTGEIVQAEEVVYANADNTVITANETTTATIEIPAGAVTGDSTDLRTTIRSCNDTLQGRPNNLAGASMRVDVSLASGQTTFGGQMVTVTLSYPDRDQDGFVDGTQLPEDQIDLWVYTAANGWEKIEPVTRDPEANTVSGQTSHFSTFLLVGPGAAANMNNVTVTPNPYRPNDGVAATGLPFSAGVQGTGIYFVNLPSQVRIEVFTITGRRVASITSTASTGTIQWDAKNEDGRDVASGWYVYVVTDLSTGERKTGKLAVIR